MDNSKNYCGIVFIGGGSSWAYAATPEDAAKLAAKKAKKDWSSLYEFKPKHQLKVVLLEMKEHDGWYADYSGIFDTETHEKIPPLRVDTVSV